jgi:hypothetical protein
MKKGARPEDPRGLIHESFRIDGINETQCRTIFLDWALWLPDEIDPVEAATRLRDLYTASYPGHPMLEVLREAGVRTDQPRRRKRRT